MKKVDIICGLLVGVSIIGLAIMLSGVFENNDNIVHLGLALVLIPSLPVKFISIVKETYEEEK